MHEYVPACDFLGMGLDYARVATSLIGFAWLP